MVKSAVRYEPGPDFHEKKEEAMLDISPTDSTELWLMQWPLNTVLASDFHGEQVSLKLQQDGNLGSLQSSSGKSYELVSFAAQQPDATVFLPSGSEMKAVGKISRRVSLVRYPEPEEFNKEKPGFSSLTPSSKKSAATSRKTKSRFTSSSKNHSSQGSALSLGEKSAEPTPKHKHSSSKNHSSQGSALSVGEKSAEQTPKHKHSSSKNHSSQGSALSLGEKSDEATPKHKQKRKGESSLGHSNVSGRSSEGSQAGGAESNTASEMEQTPVERSKKKKKKVTIAE